MRLVLVLVMGHNALAHNHSAAPEWCLHPARPSSPPPARLFSFCTAYPCHGATQPHWISTHWISITYTAHTGEMILLQRMSKGGGRLSALAPPPAQHPQKAALVVSSCRQNNTTRHDTPEEYHLMKRLYYKMAVAEQTRLITHTAHP